jgi:small-conductance mechanosensitive channel
MEGLLASPAPSVGFIPGFGEYSLNFSLYLQIRQFTDQYPVQSEMRKRVLKKFEEAGIEMPYPTHSLLFDKSARNLPGIDSQS